jgi:plasmid stabilization system protein ParE
MAEIEVAFHPEARAEYLEALERYLDLSHRVGRSFQQQVDRSVQLIESGPEQWPIFEDPVRFIRLRRFPYVLYYERVDAAVVQVLAVAHASRRPGYWRRRRED